MVIVVGIGYGKALDGIAYWFCLLLYEQVYMIGHQAPCEDGTIGFRRFAVVIHWHDYLHEGVDELGGVLYLRCVALLLYEHCLGYGHLGECEEAFAEFVK